MRIPWRLALPETAKERFKGQGHTFERLLRCLRRQWHLFLLPEHGQIPTLRNKAQGRTLPFPGHTALFQRGIVLTIYTFA